MKTYRLVGVETRDVPPLEVQASCERVAVARLAKMLVQHHCREKGLPYYTCGCTMIGDAGAHALSLDLGSITEANWRTALQVAPDPRRRRYQAFRYIAGGSRTPQGKSVRFSSWVDPETAPEMGTTRAGHFVPCRGPWRVEEVP